LGVAGRLLAFRVQDVDVVRANRRIGSEDGEILDLRLRDEQWIERVAMMWRERRHAQDMRELDRECLRSEGRQPRRHERGGRFWQSQFAEAQLDGDLPRARWRQ